ncbi:hypothetical protein ACIRG5_06610 [Lentzea sp. NPDC102401]|uniref:hypothetical protein n=1 Tax=Lentzea sp. NPDC102401 TaxID=3364128 RepID=UPI003819633E
MQPAHTDRNTCGGASKTDWGALGVVPRQPTVITLTIDGKQGPGPSRPPPVSPSPENGSFALGVGEPVPVSEYPFPPRPQTLETVRPLFGEPTIEVRADPADPAGRQEITAAWPGDNVLHAVMNTPGRIRILIDGVELVDYSNWSYSRGRHSDLARRLDDGTTGHGLLLSEGQQVKITVIPERTTGDWQVTLTAR